MKISPAPHTYQGTHTGPNSQSNRVVNGYLLHAHELWNKLKNVLGKELGRHKKMIIHYSYHL